MAEVRETGVRTDPRAVRVSVGPASRVEGDEPVTIDPADGWGLELREGARAVLVGPDGSRTGPILRGADRPAVRDRPRTVEAVVGGWRFELEVEPAARAELRERALRETAAGHAGGPLEVRAIIPGRVVSVAVAVGDAVEAGGHLLVVEAMKMQNELRAQHAGTVERVAVTAGLKVERGDLLVVLRTGPVGSHR